MWKMGGFPLNNNLFILQLRPTKVFKTASFPQEDKGKQNVDYLLL